LLSPPRSVEWEAACPGCTASLDVIPQRLLDQVHSRGTSFVAVSRAPLAKLEEYKAARGWVMPRTARPRTYRA